MFRRGAEGVKLIRGPARHGGPGQGLDHPSAALLQKNFERDFWLPELGCYALALAAGAPREVVSSNADQVLWSGIASPEHAAQVVKRLMRPDMFGGWGIRTLSVESGSYRPLGSHTGSVWPHDNALIAEGFRRYGQDVAAESILVALTEAAADFEHRRLPECFAGYARSDFGCRFAIRWPATRRPGRPAPCPIC